MLRIRERLELADHIHDGPVQELSAAVHPSSPQLDVAQTAPITDITELVLFLLAADGPPPAAHVSVQAGDETVRIDVSVTTAAPSGPAGDGDPTLR